MLGQSGFGWNITYKCVECPEDSVWEIYVKRVPDAKGFRNEPSPLYEELGLIFGKDWANGKGAETAADAVDEINNAPEEAVGEGDNAENVADGIDASTQPPPNKGSDSKATRKRRRSNDGWNSGLQEMAQQFGNFLQDNKEHMTLLASRIGQSRDMAEQRATVMDELKKLEQLSIRDRLRAAHLIAHDQDSINLFLRMDTKERIIYVDMVLRAEL